jgi:hypothetical protein
MSAEGMNKDIGLTLIEVYVVIHEFVNGDSSHLSNGAIYDSLLWNLSNMAASIWLFLCGPS